MLNTNINIKNIPTAIKLSLLVAFVFISSGSKAQLSPVGSIYFQNQYLNNPAMSGYEKGLHLNLAYKSQWSTIPGGPKTYSLTADYQLLDKMGLGFVVLNDQAGLFKRTRAVGTYSYHLPLSEKDKLRFGVSLGIMNERVDYSDVKGDQSDVMIGEFNEREMYVDVDFGLAYTSNKLTIQGAIPNLKTFFKQDEESKNIVDQATFFTAASYKLNFPNALDDGLALEPKVCFRGVKGYDNIIDMGTNISLAKDVINLFGMYHTTKNATFGLGVKYQSLFEITGIYTTNTAELKKTNGTLAVNLRINLGQTN